MDTIETFLDNMFAPYPATPRLIEARSELRAMMEDAYNDAIAQGKTHNEAVGQVITDFGNLHELAPILGIAQDIPVGLPSSWQGEQDEDDPFTNLVAGIYWPAAVVIYLLWSFIFDAWDISWILWPVAAVAFAIFASVRNYRRDRQ